MIGSIRIAVSRLRAAVRLRGRYGAEQTVADHIDAALAELERAARAEDDTKRTEAQKP